MKIRRLFETPSLTYHMVLETLDGRFMKFRVAPARHITEKDLSPIPHYQANGRNAVEAREVFYNIYGLEKEESR